MSAGSRVGSQRLPLSYAELSRSRTLGTTLAAPDGRVGWGAGEGPGPGGEGVVGDGERSAGGMGGDQWGSPSSISRRLPCHTPGLTWDATTHTLLPDARAPPSRWAPTPYPGRPPGPDGVPSPMSQAAGDH